MQRERLQPRPDWPTQMEAIGFSYHSIGGPYWDESRCYRFTMAEVDALEEATAALHAMALEAARHVVRTGTMDRFAIPPACWSQVAQSLSAHEQDQPAGFALMGRMDLSYDGVHPPKLLEYNADTPTALLEASVAQWTWLQACKPAADQFNSIHERLVAAWTRVRASCGAEAGCLHFCASAEAEEDWGNLNDLRDTAVQAGWQTVALPIERVGFDGTQFVDEAHQPITRLFKLYSWEWLVHEAFGAPLRRSPMQVIEPAWKMLLSNKALLVVLLELSPGHPNLLPASFDGAGLDASARGAALGAAVGAAAIGAPAGVSGHVIKPLLSREGANIVWVHGDQRIDTDGGYGAEGHIVQALAPLPRFGDDFTVVGSWVIDGAPAGIGLREDSSPITRNSSRFVPHYVVD